MKPIRRVWVTRTRPGADCTARRLSDLAFDPVVAPLLEARPVPHDADLSGVVAVAFTSAHAVSAFQVSEARAIPIFAVGDATAEAARAAGYATVHSADGDVGRLDRMIVAQAELGVILHPRGREVAAPLALGDGREPRDLIVYETVAAATAWPQAFDAVLLQSPRAARILAERWPDGWPDRTAACQSRAIADALGSTTFAEVRVASDPRETDLLQLLGKPGPPV